MINKLLCWLDIHNWITHGAFNYCGRPCCTHVVWFTGEGYWDLDICDTRWVDNTITVMD